MKKFKKILASALAILSTTSIVTVQGIKPTENPVDTSIIEEKPSEEITEQFFSQALALTGIYYGVKSFRDYVNAYPEPFTSPKMMGLKKLFQILNERKPIKRDQIEKILIESNLTNFNSFLEFLKSIFPNSIASVIINITTENKVIYFNEKVKGNVKPEATGMIIGLTSNSHSCYLKNYDIVYCEELKKIFKLNSICACDESGFGHYFLNDGYNWYEYNSKGMTPVDGKYIADSVSPYTIICFSYKIV